MDLPDLQTPLRDSGDGATPSRCPQCRQAEEAAASHLDVAPALPEAAEEANDEFENSALSALAAIQLEVAEEAARGPTVAVPVLRYAEESLEHSSHNRPRLYGSGRAGCRRGVCRIAVRLARGLRPAGHARSSRFDLRIDRGLWRRTHRGASRSLPSTRQFASCWISRKIRNRDNSCTNLRSTPMLSDRHRMES